MSGLLAGGGQCDPGAAECVQGQPLAGLAVGAAVFIDPALVMEGEEGLDLADDFAAGGFGFEDLVEEAKEGAAHAEDALAARVAALMAARGWAWAATSIAESRLRHSQTVEPLSGRA